MSEALWTGATVHVHLQCYLADDDQGGHRQTDDWCLVGWRADGQPMTRAQVSLDGEAFLAGLDLGDLRAALAVLRCALPGARIRVAGPGAAAGYPEPFFQATRSLHQQLRPESWRWEQVGTDFLPVAIQE